MLTAHEGHASAPSVTCSAGRSRTRGLGGPRPVGRLGGSPRPEFDPHPFGVPPYRRCPTRQLGRLEAQVLDPGGRCRMSYALPTAAT
jgi:hypothetical protein